MPFSTRPQDLDGNYNPQRKSFRSFPEVKRAKHGNGNGNGSYARGNNGNGSNATKQAPPESTNAENFYYLKQMSARTPMVIVMTDGEEIRGWIEWYDKNAIKVNREGAPNLLIRKQCIKYLYKQEDAE